MRIRKPKDMSIGDLLNQLVEGEAPEWAEKIARERLVGAVEEELEWLIGRLCGRDRDLVYSHLMDAWKAAEEDLERELRERNIDAAGDYLERIRDAEGWY